ncbi:MAG: dTDP-glucose 4,6-dehydratase [Phycisphaerae bacterium]|nr:dTDP-glucose 4,6-dehydratase [Phycisphaerae bacterium]
MQKIMVTGGAGFIGSCFVQRWIDKQNTDLVNFDALTYAGHLESIMRVAESPRYSFIHADLRSFDEVKQAIIDQRPSMILHLAAETHVDRSIDNPLQFVTTNVTGTSILLEATLQYWRSLSDSQQESFRLLHVSTDEVYGPIAGKEKAIEGDPYAPSSPYAASKASADHIVRSYYRTYKLPVILVHPTNNYGPRQFPEKFIPHFIFRALKGEGLPLYGDGAQQRDWLYVDDHCEALETLLTKGIPGESYHLGSGQLRSNLEVARQICIEIDRQAETIKENSGGTLDRITFVEDRPGHDNRYALDCSKVHRTIGWHAATTFEDGITATVAWYLKNSKWMNSVCGAYEGRRIGLR